MDCSGDNCIRSFRRHCLHALTTLLRSFSIRDSPGVTIVRSVCKRMSLSTPISVSFSIIHFSRSAFGGAASTVSRRKVVGSVFRRSLTAQNTSRRLIRVMTASASVPHPSNRQTWSPGFNRRTCCRWCASESSSAMVSGNNDSQNARGGTIRALSIQNSAAVYFRTVASHHPAAGRDGNSGMQRFRY